MKLSLGIALFLAALCTASPAVRPEFLQKVFKYVNICTKRHGTNQGDLLTYILQRGEIRDQRLKCTIECYIKEAGLLKNGGIDWERAKERTKENFDDAESIQKAMAIADSCKQKVTGRVTGDCELGPKVLRCLLDEAQTENSKEKGDRPCHFSFNKKLNGSKYPEVHRCLETFGEPFRIA